MVGAQTEWFCGTPREAAEKDTRLRGGGDVYIYSEVQRCEALGEKLDYIQSQQCGVPSLMPKQSLYPPGAGPAGPPMQAVSAAGFLLFEWLLAPVELLVDSRDLDLPSCLCCRCCLLA